MAEDDVSSASNSVTLANRHSAMATGQTESESGGPATDAPVSVFDDSFSSPTKDGALMIALDGSATSEEEVQEAATVLTMMTTAGLPTMTANNSNSNTALPVITLSDSEDEAEAGDQQDDGQKQQSQPQQAHPAEGTQLDLASLKGANEDLLAALTAIVGMATSEPVPVQPETSAPETQTLPEDSEKITDLDGQLYGTLDPHLQGFYFPGSQEELAQHQLQLQQQQTDPETESGPGATSSSSAYFMPFYAPSSVYPGGGVFTGPDGNTYQAQQWQASSPYGSIDANAGDYYHTGATYCFAENGTMYAHPTSGPTGLKQEPMDETVLLQEAAANFESAYQESAQQQQEQLHQQQMYQHQQMFASEAFNGQLQYSQQEMTPGQHSAQPPKTRKVKPATARQLQLEASINFDQASSLDEATLCELAARYAHQRFPVKLWNLATDATFEPIKWSPTGDSLIIDEYNLEGTLRHFFRSHKFSSFLRQLHLYGFRKLTRVRSHKADQERSRADFVSEYKAPDFEAGCADKLKKVRRFYGNLEGGKKGSKSPSTPPPPPQSAQPLMGVSSHPGTLSMPSIEPYIPMPKYTIDSAGYHQQHQQQHTYYTPMGTNTFESNFGSNQTSQPSMDPQQQTYYFILPPPSASATHTITTSTASTATEATVETMTSDSGEESKSSEEDTSEVTGDAQ